MTKKGFSIVDMILIYDYNVSFSLQNSNILSLYNGTNNIALCLNCFVH